MGSAIDQPSTPRRLGLGGPLAGELRMGYSALIFVITPAEATAVVKAYRASGSLEAATAVLRAMFCALTESQARRIAAQIVGVPHDRGIFPATPVLHFTHTT